MATSDLLKDCPLFLQKRYSSLGQYVRSRIETDIQGVESRDLSKEALEMIQIISFVYVLTDFLRDSHVAAKKSVETFERLGVREFRIGSARFAKGSDAVEAGRILGEQLLDAIDDPKLRSLITESNSLGELIEDLTSQIRNA